MHFPTLCTPFLLVAQSGCRGTSHRVCIPAAERGREEYNSLELCCQDSPRVCAHPTNLLWASTRPRGPDFETPVISPLADLISGHKPQATSESIILVLPELNSGDTPRVSYTPGGSRVCLCFSQAAPASWRASSPGSTRICR